MDFLLTANFWICAVFSNSDFKRTLFMLNSCYTLPAYFQTRVSESGAIKRLLNTLSTMCILNWMHWRKWAKMVPIKISLALSSASEKYPAPFFDKIYMIKIFVHRIYLVSVKRSIKKIENSDFMTLICFQNDHWNGIVALVQCRYTEGWGNFKQDFK